MTKAERREANKAAWAAVTAASAGDIARRNEMWEQRRRDLAKPLPMKGGCSEPALMQVMEKAGQRFVCVGWQPHIKTNGEPTVLIQWASRCADCGAPFQGLAAARPEGPMVRRCELHRSPGRRVRAHG